MDSAHHVITRILNPQILSKTASYDAASNISYGRMDSVRHVIKRIFVPRFLSSMAPFDVASTIHQSLEAGIGHRNVSSVAPGWAVQVDPIKSTLKAPGTERLKLT